MDHRPITESTIDEWEQRTLLKLTELKSAITSIATDMRHHAQGLKQIQADGQLDESEVARLRAANSTLKEQLKNQRAIIDASAEDLLTIRRLLFPEV